MIYYVRNPPATLSRMLEATKVQVQIVRGRATVYSYGSALERLGDAHGLGDFAREDGGVEAKLGIVGLLERPRAPSQTC